MPTQMIKHCWTGEVVEATSTSTSMQQKTQADRICYKGLMEKAGQAVVIPCALQALKHSHTSWRPQNTWDMLIGLTWTMERCYAFQPHHPLHDGLIMMSQTHEVYHGGGEVEVWREYANNRSSMRLINLGNYWRTQGIEICPY